VFVGQALIGVIGLVGLVVCRLYWVGISPNRDIQGREVIKWAVPVTWLHFMLELPGAMVYVPGVSQTLEKRVEDLEKKVAELSAETSRPTRKKDWRRTIGIFKDDPDFEEAVRLGREYRQQQTYEKEIAGS